MPMDEYDLSHTASKHDHVFNFYGNDWATTGSRGTVKDAVKENVASVLRSRYNSPSQEQLKTNERTLAQVLSTAERLKNGLELFDFRTVTNIGGRVSHYVIHTNEDNQSRHVQKWILVQVWRSDSP